MPEHPIENLMKTAMDSIKEMIDVNTILGDPVEAPDGNVILPVSRVTFGFAAGGTEFAAQVGHQRKSGEDGSQSGTSEELPFGGGSGAGISLQPTAFLVVGHGEVRLLPVNEGAIANRLIDVAPQLVERLQGMFGRRNSEQTGANPGGFRGGASI